MVVEEGLKLFFVISRLFAFVVRFGALNTSPNEVVLSGFHAFVPVFLGVGATKVWSTLGFKYIRFRAPNVSII